MFQLSYFNPHKQMPPCPGHSENHGRMLYHLFWEVTDMDPFRRNLLNERAIKISSFPGLIPSRSGDKQSLSVLALKFNKFTAREAESIRCWFIFAVIGFPYSDKYLI